MVCTGKYDRNCPAMLTRRTLFAAGAAVAATPLVGTWHAEAKTPNGVFVMAKQIDDIVAFDPAQSFEFTNGEINANCYSRLVRPDIKDTNKVVGDLASSWDVSKDGKQITFHLHTNAKFATGKVVTAEDAAFSLHRAVILNLTPAFIISQLGFTKDNVEKLIVAKDAKTLVLNLPESWATSFVLFCLSATIGSVVEKAVVMAHAENGDLGNGWMKTRTAGSGTYQLTSWKASDRVVCDVNPHAEAKAHNKRVVIRHVPEPSAQLLALERADADVARDLTPELLKQARDQKGFHVVSAGTGRTLYMQMNAAVPQLKKVPVRQAIKWAIDYDGIAKNITPDTYVVCQTFLPPGLPGALAAKPFKRDVAKAKALLAEAGYPDGFEISMDHSNTTPDSDIAQAIQANLKDIGIKVTLIPGERKQVITKSRNRTQELSLGQWGTDYFDPNSNTQNFCENPDDSNNSMLKTSAWRCHYSDPEVTALAVAAAKELDSAKRIAMYHTLQQKVQAEAPFAFMLQPIVTAVMGKGVSGFGVGPVADFTKYGDVKKT
jgi:peptide/nickel transport system substrate-binding protein